MEKRILLVNCFYYTFNSLVLGGKKYISKEFFDVEKKLLDISNSEQFWMICLLGLPIALQFVCTLLFVLRNVNRDKRLSKFYVYYLTIVIFSLFSYLLFWIGYTSNWIYEELSNIILLFIFILMAVVLILSYIIIQHNLPKGGPKKRDGILTDIEYGIYKLPFWTILLFFTVFLSIAYLFGFAFAFHDRDKCRRDELNKKTPVPALFKAKEYPMELDSQKTQEAEKKDAPVKSEENKIDICNTLLMNRFITPTVPNFYFYFDVPTSKPAFQAIKIRFKHIR